MLASIAGLDRSRASTVLAVAAQRLLGNVHPDLAQTEILNNDKVLADRVIDELQIQIGLRSEETEDQRLGRLNDALSRAMSDTVLKGADLNTIRNRAGQKGTLPSSLYRIVFTPTFEAQAPLFAVKKAYVEDTVRHADITEHLRPKSGLPTGVYVSLFVKTPRIRDHNKYTLLVKCNRVGAQLLIEHAFYLFHDTFKVNMRANPLTVLLAFLEKFGMPIVIEGKQRDYIIAASFEIPDTGTLTLSNHDGTQKVLLSGAPGEKIGVLLMYSFDNSKYRVYLREHGLDSKAVPPVFAHTHEQIWRPGEVVGG